MPVSSASGTNSDGSRRPRPGWFQRTSASAALTSPVSSETIGWYSTISWPRSTALWSSSFRPWRFSTASRMVGSNIAWRPLPDSFAWYMARSALRISSSASWLSCVVAMPIERWTKMISPAALTGCSKDFMMRSATIVALSLTERSSVTITANSSPPSRAIASSGRTESRRRCATATSSSSPGAVAERVVEGLEVVEVDEQHGDLAGVLVEGSLHLVGEQAAVREVGERIVERLVVQLLLQRAQLVDGLLQAVVLERDARVVGECLEELQVLVGERADHAVAVGEHDRPDHAVLTGQHRDHRIGDEAPVEVAPQPFGSERAGDVERRPVGIDEGPQLAGHDRVHRLHHLLVVPGPQGGPQRWVALGAEQHDLGHLRPERLERALQQALQRQHHLGRARERAGRLVQELEPLVALALHQVGAVGQVDDERRHGQQRDRPRVGRHDDRARQAQRGVGGRHDEVHGEHLPDRAEPQGALRERDREPDQHHGDHGARLGPEQHREPSVGVERGARRERRRAPRSSRAMPQSANWERLKTSFTGASRRSIASVAADPSTAPSTRSPPVANSRPNTSGRSPSEKECALRRNCRWTTQLSATRKPTASAPPGQMGIDQRRQVVHDRHEQGERGCGDRRGSATTPG